MKPKQAPENPAGGDRPRVEAETAASTERLDLGHLNQHVGYFIRRLQVAVFKDFIQRLSDINVRPAQYSVLLVIEANPGRSQAAIGQALSIERARLARLLHELERRKWIDRRASGRDGRSHSLFLTPEGEKALVRIKTITSQHEQHFAKVIGPKRREQLLDLLRDFG
jgi:DNA-binding MarR family transcriptional regulator